MPTILDVLEAHFYGSGASMDIHKPLKRRIKIKKVGGDWLWVDFKYKRLHTFCFIFGCLEHEDRKCSKLYDYLDGNIPRPFGPWLKAASCRTSFGSGFS